MGSRHGNEFHINGIFLAFRNIEDLEHRKTAVIDSVEKPK